MYVNGSALRILVIGLAIHFLFPITSVYSLTILHQLEKLPTITQAYLDDAQGGWLVKKIDKKVRVFKNDKNNELILSNGLFSRTFRLTPNAATISLKIINNQQELVRAVKPEAVVTINGFTIDVGGLTGQPNLAFLYPDWIDELKANPLSFICSSFNVDEPVVQFEWKRVRHHAPDVEWPLKGVKLQMNYRLGDLSSEDLIALSRESEVGRHEIYYDDFTTLSKVWKIRTSPANDRSSFMNEGK